MTQVSLPLKIRTEKIQVTWRDYNETASFSELLEKSGIKLGYHALPVSSKNISGGKVEITVRQMTKKEYAKYLHALAFETARREGLPLPLPPGVKQPKKGSKAAPPKPAPKPVRRATPPAPPKLHNGKML